VHELHLMTQVVKAVEAELHGTEDARLSIVRLKISAGSHLLTHDMATLQAAFQLAARGTRAEGARLEVIPVPRDAWCPECQRDVSVIPAHNVCPACRGSVVMGSTVPEVLLHELVVAE
jgi:hydrogenase nickel incorporation protein HypA/HybF